jgi:hypothetical protein
MTYSNIFSEKQLQSLKEKMPSLKTQAQFQAFSIAFEAMQLLMNAVFSGHKEDETRARVLFEYAIDTARKISDLTVRLKDHPEAVKDEDNPFVQPVQASSDKVAQESLLQELQGVTSVKELNLWYDATRARRNLISDAPLRNQLIDAIREKRITLGGN